ncbi:DUF192 domain-containing protein [Candidatus Dojkabacteria bacterium]|nr:DUF192 domain-containing protein [Candidatus Dojkabacteria bacterium]
MRQIKNISGPAIAISVLILVFVVILWISGIWGSIFTNFDVDDYQDSDDSSRENAEEYNGENSDSNDTSLDENNLSDETDNSDDSNNDMNEYQNLKKVTVSNDSNQYSVYVEEARTVAEVTQGLMYRTELCDKCGMLFYFDYDNQSGFWMKNCEISLDIVFIDKTGKIVDIKHSFEPCHSAYCPSYSPSSPYRYVLEVNGGWCNEHGVTIGNKVTGI